MKNKLKLILKVTLLFSFFVCFTKTTLYGQTVTIAGNLDTSSQIITGRFQNHGLEALYLENELGSANFTTAATAIRSLSFYLASGTLNISGNFKIYLKNIKPEITNFINTPYSYNNYVMVYSGSFVASDTGWKSFDLSTPFVRTAGSNLQILVERVNGAIPPGAPQVYVSKGNSISVNANTCKTLNYAGASSFVTQGNITLTTTNLRPAIRFSATPVGGALPLVVSNPPSLVANSTVTLGGQVTDAGASAVTERGIVYATSHYPTIANTKVAIGSGLGSFSQNITGLTPSTTYYVRTYATNSNGTAYGPQVALTTSFTTPALLTLNSFTPDAGAPGTTITLKGKNFNPLLAANAVYFGTLRAKVLSKTDTTLLVQVPFGLGTCNIKVRDTISGFMAFCGQNFKPSFTPFKTGLSQADFDPIKRTISGAETRRMIMADIDGDGAMDAISLNFTSDSLIGILRNTSTKGNVSFAPRVTIEAPEGGLRIHAEDLNADGKPEIIALTYTKSILSIFPNQSTPGNIVFGTRIDLPVGQNASLAIGDYDRNGKPDLAVINQINNTFNTFRNISSGGNIVFEPRKIYTSSMFGSSSPTQILTQDFNADGFDDFLIVTNFQRTFRIFRNSGARDSIHFIENSVFVLDSLGGEYVLADMDRDGETEIQRLERYGNYTTIKSFLDQTQSNYISYVDTADFGFSTGMNSVLMLSPLDGEGWEDFYNISSSDTLLRLNNMSATSKYQFTPNGKFRVVGVKTTYNFADVDGDSLIDLIGTSGTGVGAYLEVLRQRYPITNNTISGGGKTICGGNSADTLFGSTVNNPYSRIYKYRWIKSETNANSGYMEMSPADTLIYLSPGALTKTTWFKRVCAWDYSADTSGAQSITVVNLAANTIGSNQTINSGQVPAQLTGSLVSGVSYRWLRSADSLGVFIPAPGVINSQNYSPAALTQNWFYRRVIFVSGCFDTSLPVKITVISSGLTNNVISTSHAKCKGDSANLLTGTTPAGGTPPYTYKWISATAGINGPYTDAAGVNNGINYQHGLLTQDIWYRRIATDGTKTDTSLSIKLTAVDLSNNAIGSNQVIVTGSVPAPLQGATVSPGVPFSYRWLVSNQMNTGFTLAGGKFDSVHYVPGALSQNTYYKRAILSAGCNDTSNVVSITMATTGISNNVIMGDQTLCVGSQPDALVGNVPSGGNPPLQYLWLSSIVSGAAALAPAPGVNNLKDYYPAALVQTTWYRRIAYDASNADTSEWVTLTAKPTPTKPVISIQPATPICIGTEYLNFGASTLPQANESYQWTATGASVYAQGSTKQYCLVSFNQSGPAKVILTASLNGCSSSDEVSYTIESDTSHKATVRYFNSNFVCEANMVQRYQWGYDETGILEGVVLTNQINQNFYLANPDFATKNYWVISTKGNCYQKSYYNQPSGILTHASNEMRVIAYPNPATHSVKVKQTAKEEIFIKVLNIHGEELLSLETREVETELNLQDLSAGVYILRVIGKDESTQDIKLIKY